MSDTDTDSAPLPKLEPAVLGARISAGLFDVAVTVVLVTILFVLPLRIGGITMPMLAIFAVVLGYTVVPVWLFRRTLGMRLFGVELIGRSGQPADLFDLLFREMIGRGLFAVAYLGSMLVGIIGLITGSATMQFPTGLGFFLFGLALLVLAVSAVGHVAILTRPDRRGLADLMGKTMVIPWTPSALPVDTEEREELLRSRQRITRNFVVFEVVLVVLALGIPVGTILRGRSHQQAVAETATRLQLRLNMERFKADPTNPTLTEEIASTLEAQGQTAEAQAIRDKHHAAWNDVLKQRESALRERVTQDPADEEAVNGLIEMLGEQDRKVDARKVYEAYLAANPGPERQAGFGVWLYQNGFSADAVQVLTTAIAAGVEAPEAHAYLGFSLEETGRLDEARKALADAVRLDPDLDEARTELDTLNKLGNPPRAPAAHQPKPGN
jgi:uncharacterized RDD family membrane protein YckC/Flp pilus assembly protein TadD